jgi:hypothetical protein
MVDMLRRAGLLACTWIGLAMVSGPWPARAAEAAPAQIIDLTYDVYLGGLHIFSFDVDLALQADRYRVSADGMTRGMVGFLYGWDVKLAAEGLDHDGRIEAVRYSSDSAWKGKRRTVQLSFLDGGRYDLQRDPPPEPDPDIEGGLPDVIPEDTADPLALAVAASRAIERTGRCDQSVPVFDGQRRYDVTLMQIEETILPESAYSFYQGPAMRCSVSIRRISGFRKSWRSKSAGDSAPPPSLWIARVRDDLPPLPVRYDGTIALGNMVIHLTNASVRTQPAEAAP